MNFSCVSFDYQEIIRTFSIRDLSFGIYAKFFKKLHFLPLHLHTYVCVHMFFRTGVLKNFVIFTGKHLYWSLFCIGVSVLESEGL